MTLVRYNPVSPHKRWSNLFEEFFGRNFNEDEIVQRVWAPRVDITEVKDVYKVHADLPGMSREDVQITIEDGVLTISGERESQSEKSDETCHLSERIYGKFSRSFTLRNSINTDKIDAKFKDGVLTIDLPKVEEALPRRIEIKAH